MTWDPHWRMVLMKVRQLEASSKHQRCGEFRKPGRRTCTMVARRRFTMRLPVTAAKLKSLRLRIRGLVKLNVPPFSHFFDRSRLTNSRSCDSRFTLVPCAFAVSAFLISRRRVDANPVIVMSRFERLHDIPGIHLPLLHDDRPGAEQSTKVGEVGRQPFDVLRPDAGAQLVVQMRKQ